MTIFLFSVGYWNLPQGDTILINSKQNEELLLYTCKGYTVGYDWVTVYYYETYTQAYTVYYQKSYKAYKSVVDNSCGWICGCGTSWPWKNCYKAVAYTKTYSVSQTKYRTATRKKSKQVKQSRAAMFTKCQITSDRSNRFTMKGKFSIFS